MSRRSSHDGSTESRYDGESQSVGRVVRAGTDFEGIDDRGADALERLFAGTPATGATGKVIALRDESAAFRIDANQMLHASILHPWLRIGCPLRGAPAIVGRDEAHAPALALGTVAPRVPYGFWGGERSRQFVDCRLGVLAHAPRRARNRVPRECNVLGFSHAPARP